MEAPAAETPAVCLKASCTREIAYECVPCNCPTNAVENVRKPICSSVVHDHASSEEIGGAGVNRDPKQSPSWPSPMMMGVSNFGKGRR